MQGRIEGAQADQPKPMVDSEQIETVETERDMPDGHDHQACRAEPQSSAPHSRCLSR